MLSAFIPSELGYSAMHLVIQLMHHRFLHPGPLVLGAAPLKYLTPVIDKDRTVSRRSEPSSRTALMGEQPNPWNVLPLQEFPLTTIGSLSPAFASARPVSLAVSLASAFALEHTISDRAKLNFERLRYCLGGDRPSQTTHLTLSTYRITATC